MYFKKTISLFVDFFLFYSLLDAQEDTVSHYSLLLDDFDFEEQAVSEEDWQIIDELRKRYSQPVNINAITREELQCFPFLNEQQIENILAYVYQHPLKTVYELQLIDGLDKSTLDYLIQLVTVEEIDTRESSSFKRILSKARHEFSTRFDFPFYKREGYNDKFLGSSWYSNIRYSMQASHRIEWGINLEKDSGEPFFALGNRKGYDYLSYYFVFNNWGFLKRMIVGNYKLNFGEGLVLGFPGFIKHSLRSLLHFPSSTSLMRHSSNDEYNYLSGIAATFQCSKNIDISLFYSFRKLDAHKVDDHIETIYKNGLHRTEDDFSNRKRLNEQLIGGNFNFSHRDLLLGFTGTYLAYNYPYYPKLKKYNLYYPRGKSFYNFGLYYRYFWKQFGIKGEIALGKKGLAVLNNLKYHPKSNLDFLILHRFYSYTYWGIFSNAYSMNSRIQNENGWAFICQYLPSSNYSLYFSADFYSSPWWKYRISKPSKGFNGDIKIERKSKKMACSFQYAFKYKERDVKETHGEVTLPVSQHKLRSTFIFYLPNISLKTVVDYIYFYQASQSKSQGYHFTQCGDIALNAVHVSLQGTFFNTNDYDSRVYVYEKGVLYNYAMSSLNGKGYRLSCVVRTDLSTHMMFMLKWGDTHYFNRESIGSGMEKIDKRDKMDLQFLFRVKF